MSPAASHAGPTASAAPIPLPVTVDTTGAKILDGSNAERDSRDIYLPNHVETVSHIAIDVGGSLAKVVYFTRLARPTATTISSLPTASHAAAQEAHEQPQQWHAQTASNGASASSSRLHSRESSAAGAHLADSTGSLASAVSVAGQAHARPLRSADGSTAVPGGTLTPTSLFASSSAVSASAIHSQFMRRRSLPSQLPGGRLNFVKFETADIQSCVDFLVELITLSAKANNVSLAQMRKGVKLMATGGGAHLFYDMFERELGVEVRREDEMGCLITGLNFITLIPDETFYYSDELVDNINATRPGPRTARIDDSRQEGGSRKSSRSASSSSESGTQPFETGQQQQPLPRPSPDPPLYSPIFDSNPLPKLPCLLVNIGSGVSIIKVDEDGKHERVSGTSLGGATLWGLLSLITDADSFDEMLEMASRGDNSTVDMLVSDVYGASDALNNLGLKSTTIASSFGKVFRKDKSVPNAESPEQRRKRFRQEDICKSLLYAVSNNIGQIAYMNAEKFGLDRIYFGGCFIRGHQATIATLSYAIRFWSKGTKRAFFLRHEGYLGALGAWIRQFYDSNGTPTTPRSPNPLSTVHARAARRSDSHGEPGSRESSVDVSSIDVSASNSALPSSMQRMDTVTSAQDTPRQTTQLFGNGIGAGAPLNPILAEALGTTSLDDGANNVALQRHVNGTADDTPAPALNLGQSNGHREQSAGINDLFATLSTQDQQILAPVLDDGKIDELIANGDEASIAELLAKMDAMHGAADGLEDRLDSLLARLDGILESAPEDQAG